MRYAQKMLNKYCQKHHETYLISVCYQNFKILTTQIVIKTKEAKSHYLANLTSKVLRN